MPSPWLFPFPRVNDLTRLPVPPTPSRFLTDFLHPFKGVRDYFPLSYLSQLFPYPLPLFSFFTQYVLHDKYSYYLERDARYFQQVIGRFKVTTELIAKVLHRRVQHYDNTKATLWVAAFRKECGSAIMSAKLGHNHRFNSHLVASHKFACDAISMDRMRGGLCADPNPYGGDYPYPKPPPYCHPEADPLFGCYDYIASYPDALYDDPIRGWGQLGSFPDAQSYPFYNEIFALPAFSPIVPVPSSAPITVASFVLAASATPPLVVASSPLPDTLFSSSPWPLHPVAGVTPSPGPVNTPPSPVISTEIDDRDSLSVDYGGGYQMHHSRGFRN